MPECKRLHYEMQALTFYRPLQHQPAENGFIQQMRTSHNPTLEDVAKAAGVSTATISRALNSPLKVARPTRERIQAVVDQLGYTPNFGGKVLASNRSNTIGAVIPTMSNAMFAGGLQAFQEVLSGAGKKLLVATAGYDANDEFEQIRSLVTHGADALFLIGTTRPQKTTEFLALRNIPYVLSWCYQDDSKHTYSGFNNEQSARSLANRVMDYGHRRIAMIGGQTTGNDRAADRIAGVASAVRDYGDGARLIHQSEAGYSLDSGGAAFEEIMGLQSPPTAIICGNDVLAAGATIRARELGIRIPEQVSITGFDDLDLASVVSPALTTVRVPQNQMGTEAAKLLLKLLDGEPDVRSVELETRIIERESLRQL